MTFPEDIKDISVSMPLNPTHLNVRGARHPCGPVYAPFTLKAFRVLPSLSENGNLALTG